MCWMPLILASTDLMYPPLAREQSCRVALWGEGDGPFRKSHASFRAKYLEARACILREADQVWTDGFISDTTHVAVLGCPI